MENISVLRKAQLAQLKIMDAVHDACVKNGITYYIIGGTALGARRHKGFIPWDVDIDIAMPRKDYDRFLELSPQILPSEFHCLHFRNNKKHYSPHALVILRNSKLIQQEDDLNGTMNKEIYIDIMPLDNAPQTVELQIKHANKIKLIKKIKYYKQSRIFKSNSVVVATAKRLIRVLLSIIPWEFINKLQHKQFVKYSDQDTGLLCSMASQYSYSKQCMDATIYGMPQLMEFESRTYYAPEKIEAYLFRIYGDFLKIPSVKEQETSAAMILDVMCEL